MGKKKVLKNPEVSLSKSDETCLKKIIDKATMNAVEQIKFELEKKVKYYEKQKKKLHSRVADWQKRATDYGVLKRTMKLSKDLNKEKRDLAAESRTLEKFADEVGNKLKYMQKFLKNKDLNMLPIDFRIYVVGYIGATMGTMAMKQLNIGNFNGMEVDLYIDKGYNITALNAYTTQDRRELTLYKKGK